ncbi:hypothetical protein Hanom_Chr16g01484471 [Helianthus anomalus]
MVVFPTLTPLNLAPVDDVNFDNLESRFLEDGVFIPKDVKMKGMKGSKPECMMVLKKFSSRDMVVTVLRRRGCGLWWEAG